ncbi:PREDICTED: uncharacterized protein LOC109589499, partial [Amphimedon queenslandica]|uniref:Uncharacterized protein n=1 Tax=Amphimedon queenslandica TaxID=400682 RepID=A0AAN0JW55_AMPQE
PPKRKFKIDVELLATYIASEGNPPRKASCLEGGYWYLAAKFCTSSKQPSNRLCLAVRNYYAQNLKSLLEKVAELRNNTCKVTINDKPMDQESVSVAHTMDQESISVVHTIMEQEEDKVSS